MNKKILMGVLPILAISLVGAVLTYYVVATITLTVNQPINITGNLVQDVSCDFTGETCIGDAIRVENNADSERTITITDNSIPGIEVNYVGKLELDNKDPNTWSRIISDNRKANFYYFITGEELGYRLEAEGLDDIDYTLIYYADKEPRFSNWEGYPAKKIGSGTANSGQLVLEGSIDIGDLPFATDWNTNADPHYCDSNNTFDDYEHCFGAKIWLIPTRDYDATNEKLISWNPNDYLFETDLIHYFNSTLGEYTIGAGSFVKFYPLFNVNPYLQPGDYQINITIA